MRLTLATGPATTPITLEEAKAECRARDFNDDDELIAGIVDSVVSYLDGPEGVLGRAIVTQVWQLELAAWPSCLVLPVEPIQSVAVSYLDTSGAAQNLPDASFYLSSWPRQPSELNWAKGVTLPDVSTTAPFPVIIQMTAGFGSAASTPAAIKISMLKLTRHWYDNPGQIGDRMAELPLSVGALIAPFRRML
jgi:uncharacterized phiE125 gp8 family phage protein